VKHTPNPFARDLNMARVVAVPDLAPELLALRHKFLAEVAEDDEGLDGCFTHGRDEVAVDT
jgi:hypothetical protein